VIEAASFEKDIAESPAPGFAAANALFFDY
jgi:hypothetical protein